MVTDFLIVLVGLSIQLIFLYWREALTDRKIVPWIWAGTTPLFFSGFLLSQMFGGAMKTLPALMMPLLAYSIYRLLYWSYVALFNQIPVDTFWSMDVRLMRSGLFNFLFWFLGLVLPALLVFKVLNGLLA